MKDIMLDLETLGTRPGSAIVSIGAVEFDLEKGELGLSFCEVISLQSIENELTVDMGTVCWWMKQGDTARAVFNDYRALHINAALNKFRDYLLSAYQRNGSVHACLWGNGADFDNVLLAEAYKRCAIEVPWPFYNNRCYRTIRQHYKTFGIDPPFVREGTHHNALDDAKSQALHLIKLHAAFRNTGGNVF